MRLRNTMRKFTNSLIAFFKSFNLFETLFLTFSLITVITVSIVFKSDWLSIVYSLSAIFAMFCLSKSVYLYPIYQIISDGIYVVQSYFNGLYGESILNLFILIPIQIVTAISWFRNKRENSEIQVNKLAWQEWICIFATASALIAPVYFMLKALNTNYLIISVATFIIPIVSYYLTLRRSVFQFAAYIIQNLVIIVLWLMPIIEGGVGDIGLLPMALTFAIFGINNVYGFVNWTRKYKRQKMSIDKCDFN